MAPAPTNQSPAAAAGTPSRTPATAQRPAASPAQCGALSPPPLVRGADWEADCMSDLPQLVEELDLTPQRTTTASPAAVADVAATFRGDGWAAEPPPLNGANSGCPQHLLQAALIQHAMQQQQQQQERMMQEQQAHMMAVEQAQAVAMEQQAHAMAMIRQQQQFNNFVNCPPPPQSFVGEPQWDPQWAGFCGPMGGCAMPCPLNTPMPMPGSLGMGDPCGNPNMFLGPLGMPRQNGVLPMGMHCGGAGLSPSASVSPQGLTPTPTTLSPQMQLGTTPAGRSLSPFETQSLPSSARSLGSDPHHRQGFACSRTLMYPAPQHGKSCDELPRESPWCCDEGLALVYAPARGSNTRVSWRNKLWSNTALLKKRFVQRLPFFFRENYADRSAASEPLLHNNYPALSRVFFQGRVLPSHCVCHHLVQIFEPFAVTPDGAPDPLGLQAVWTGSPSPVGNRVYGYAKFADSRMAAAAVAALRAAVQRRVTSREVAPGAPPPQEAVNLLSEVARRTSPPLLPIPSPTAAQRVPGQWSPEARALARVLHVLGGRIQGSDSSVLTSKGFCPDEVHAAFEAVDAALQGRYGEGIVTSVVVDSSERQLACAHTACPSAREPVLFEEVSFANDQKPGHGGREGPANSMPSVGTHHSHHARHHQHHSSKHGRVSGSDMDARARGVYEGRGPQLAQSP
eukprot:TRINITY_DN4630_c6_g1_i1.p1 TRINITY_DN4630_c6_g1~~TRINITY_DN4630_c6_g1_i1.p1  ORF type:complete len:682 (+),score=162.54 TRINITY_DN4630_c6_g1_i1:88-2133(+)